MELIPKKVRSYCESGYPYGRTKFCSYLEEDNGEIIERVFAYRQKSGKSLEIMEVLRRFSEHSYCMARSLYCSPMAGYTSDFFDCSFEYIDKPINLEAFCINIEFLENTNYRYCSQRRCYCNVIEILKLYKKYPIIEMFNKMDIFYSKNLLKLASKDKKFRKFLIDNVDRVNYYNTTVILYSYKNNLPFAYSCEYLSFKRQLKSSRLFDFDFIKNNYKKVIEYLIKNDVGFYLYQDYIFACVGLKLDMTLNKNLIPHNFTLIHDLRIQEYTSMKEKEDAKKKKAFYKKFKNVSKKYSFLNYSNDFIIMIAPNVQSLLKEGKELNHCVGRMGYDKKMVNEESLIFFIREREKLDTPFVTMEYSLKNKSILQIYANKNTTPCNEVIDFALHWCKMAKKLLDNVA